MVAVLHYCFSPGQYSKSRVIATSKHLNIEPLASCFIILSHCLDFQQLFSGLNNYSTKINLLYTVVLSSFLFLTNCFQPPVIFSSYRLLCLGLTSWKETQESDAGKGILSFSPSSSQGRTVLWSVLVICSLDEFWKTLHFHFPQPPIMAVLPPELLCKSK